LAGDDGVIEIARLATLDNIRYVVGEAAAKLPKLLGDFTCSN
jgi:hypothetical protein